MNLVLTNPEVYYQAGIRTVSAVSAFPSVNRFHREILPLQLRFLIAIFVLDNSDY